MGWLVGTLPLDQEESATHNLTASLLLAGMVILSSLTLAFSYKELGQRDYRTSNIPIIDQGVPRYWQEGKQCKYFENY